MPPAAAGDADRTDWKVCVVPPEEEEAQADAVKEIFKVRCPGGRGEDMRGWEWFGCCLAVRARRLI